MSILFNFFFFNDTATTEIYTLSLHDALPICASGLVARDGTAVRPVARGEPPLNRAAQCRAPRLGARGSSPTAARRERSEEHTSELQSQSISYAVFCL